MTHSSTTSAQSSSRVSFSALRKDDPAQSSTARSRTLRSHIASVLRLGWLQGTIELKHKLRPLPLLGFVFFPALCFIIYSQNDGLLGDEMNRRSLALAYVPVYLALTGILTLSSALMADQEDGTLLRAKVLPGGIPSYLMGKLITLSTAGFISSFLALLAAHAAIGGMLPDSLSTWMAFAGLVILSIASTAPLGIVLGGLARNVLVSLPVMFAGFGLVSISGVFFPLEILPGFIQGCAKVFPVYWLGELARIVLAPELFGALSWNILIENSAVPLAWMLIGLALCPRVVQLISRRQSGSRLALIQTRRLNRGY